MKNNVQITVAILLNPAFTLNMLCNFFADLLYFNNLTILNNLNILKSLYNLGIFANLSSPLLF